MSVVEFIWWTVTGNARPLRGAWFRQQPPAAAHGPGRTGIPPTTDIFAAGLLVHVALPFLLPTEYAILTRQRYGRAVMLSVAWGRRPTTAARHVLNSF